MTGPVLTGQQLACANNISKVRKKMYHIVNFVINWTLLKVRYVEFQIDCIKQS